MRGPHQNQAVSIPVVVSTHKELFLAVLYIKVAPSTIAEFFCRESLNHAMQFLMKINDAEILIIKKEN